MTVNIIKLAMANYKSKFDQLHESAFNRYTQGAGFLAGDVVKFKKNTPKSAWFLDKAASVQKLVIAMMQSENILRIGLLHKEFPHAIGAHGASDSGQMEMADIYTELSPANWAYPITVPLKQLEMVEYGINHPTVPDHLKDKNRVEKTGKKGKADKQTQIDDSNRQLPGQNVKLSGGQKWDDSKVGGGNLPKIKLRESVDSLENAYEEIIQETYEPGSVEVNVKLGIDRIPSSNEWRVSFFENGRLNDDKSQYLPDKDAAYSARERLTESLKSEGIIAESVLEDSFNQCEYADNPDGSVAITFEDTVHSHVHQDEVPVHVTATYQRNESLGGDIGTANWELVVIKAVDENNRPVPLQTNDKEYLTNRADDFVGRYTDWSAAQKTEASVVDEALGNPNVVTLGGHTITYTTQTTRGSDPTAIQTWTFDNGYSIVEFHGDFELKDPAGKRIKFDHKPEGLDRSLHHLGLPRWDAIEDAFDQAQMAQNAGEQEPDTDWDASP